jgi:hypothetical protein
MTNTNLFSINLASEAAAKAFVDELLYDPMEVVYLDYLDGLHDAGVKMTKAGKYLRGEFGMEPRLARAYVMEWIGLTDYNFEEEN